MTLPTYDEIELPLLQEIAAAGGEAKPRDIYPRMRKHFPAITDNDLELRLPSTGGSVWTNRIQWVREHLVKKGELFREPRGLWRITPQGASRAGLAAATTESDKPLALSHKPPIEPIPTIVPVTNRVDFLCDRLIKTQKQSSTPKNFEAALAEAFRFLGFDTTEQGKAGETDVLLNTHVGADSFRVVVDAKATHGDKVSDNQINWLAINQHQHLAQADHAAVIGIDFRGGNLVKWANEYHIALIKTADLVDVIRMHRLTPFSLVDLRPLFATPGHVHESLQGLQIIHQSSMQHWQLLLDVVELIDSYNRINKSGLVANAERIQLMLYMKIASRSPGEVDPSRVPTPDDVKDAMTFLASRAVGILREVPVEPGSYHLGMHAHIALERIRALAGHLHNLELRGESERLTTGSRTI